MSDREVSVHMTEEMLRHLRDLMATGLWGYSVEDAARRLIEEGLKRILWERKAG